MNEQVILSLETYDKLKETLNAKVFKVEVITKINEELQDKVSTVEKCIIEIILLDKNYDLTNYHSAVYDNSIYNMDYHKNSVCQYIKERNIQYTFEEIYQAFVERAENKEEEDNG